MGKQNNGGKRAVNRHQTQKTPAGAQLKVANALRAALAAARGGK